MDKSKADNAAALLSCFQEAVAHADTRDWGKRYAGRSISFADAVVEVTRVFAEQKHSFSAYGQSANGIGAEFAEALVEFPRYFSKPQPDQEEVEDAIRKAADDHAAFVVLELLALLVPRKTYPLLDDWKSSVYLGLAKRPAKKKGASRNKYLGRDTLIIGQIRHLVSLGFKATRNRGKKPGTLEASACDVVAKATESCSRDVPTMDYAAVEHIWKRRTELPRQNVTADMLLILLSQSTLGALSAKYET